MSTKGAARIALVVVLTVGAVLVGGPVAAQLGATPLVSLSNVTVSPSNPMPGEPVTLTATIQNSPESESGFEIAQIDLVDRDVVRKASDVGTLGPGDSTTVSVTTTFDSPGVKRLSLQVGGESTTGVSGTTVKQPVTIVVDDTRPQIDLSYGELLVGVENDLGVVVANGRSTPIRSVNVSVNGAGLALKEATKSRGTVPAGTTERFNFTVQSETVGQRPVEVRLAFTRNGITHTVSEEQTLSFKPLGEGVTTLSNVRQRPGRASPGQPFTVAFGVANRGRATIHDLTFDLSLNETTIRAGPTGTSVYVEELSGEETRTVSFELKASDDAGSGIVTLPLSYEFTTGDGRSVSKQTTISVDVLGEPELRAFLREVSRQDDAVELTVDVANVGDGVARAAAIRMNDTSYYLGEIPAGEFETATLVVPTADRYEAELTFKNGFNERLSSEASIDVGAFRTNDSGPPLLWVIVAVLAVAVAGVAVWRAIR